MRSLLNEDGRLTPRARVLWELEQKFGRVGMAEVASNMQLDIRSRALAALEQGAKRREQAADPQSLRDYQQYVREQFLACHGGLPQTDAPLNGQVLSSKEYDGFVLEKLVYQSRPQVYVTCNLYRPRSQSRPGPAVLMVMGHDDNGKAFPEYQRVAQMLVYAGFVVLMMDPVGEGERFDHYETGMDFQPIQGCSGEHDLLDWKCKLLGLSLSRYFIHDGIRGLEYLASRPEVDPSRIAVTGHSGGGTQTSMLMAAAADRIAAAAPCSYTTDERAMVEYGKDPDNEMIWPGVLAAGLDYVDLISVMAPKPVLLLTNRYDFFPREGVDRTLEEARRLWERVGSPTPPEIARSYTGHSYTATLAEAVTRFFSRHLLGKEADLTGFRFRQLPAEELWCTPSGVALKAFPDLKTVQMELEEEYNRLLAERAARPWEEVRREGVDWLRQTVFAGRKPVESNVRVTDEGVCGHYIYRGLLWRAQEGYWGAGVLLRDMRQEDRPLPTVIALWPRGVRAIEEHSAWIHRQCAQGRQVLVTDLAASGSLLPNPISQSSMHIGWGTLFIYNAFLIKLGDSIAATRIYQAISALGVVGDLPLEDSGEYAYYGEGEFARYAKIAALLTKKPVKTAGLYQGYGEIVLEKYHDQTHTVDWVLPGILRHLDMEDIDRCLREESLLGDGLTI